jgi:hypothetical protein
MVKTHLKQLERFNKEFETNISPIKTSAEMYYRFFKTKMCNTKLLGQLLNDTTHFHRYAIKNDIEIEMMESFLSDAIYKWRIETYETISNELKNNTN